MKKAVLALLTVLAIGCNPGRDDCTNKLTPERLGESNSSIGSLTQNLYLLVDNCPDFIENTFKESRPNCGIIIPYTKSTDDAISGKGTDDRYNPVTIPPNEGFMVVRHSPGYSPEIILGGMIITNDFNISCSEYYNPNPTVQQIRAIDTRRGNHNIEKAISYYAQEMAGRYDPGVKRVR